jgi:hypothetical protein
MIQRLPRLLLALSALVLFAGGLVHARAFGKALSALAAVSLPPFYANSFKALWLIDSATLIALAVVFSFIAVRPTAATRWVVVLLALIPAAIAALVYIFVGGFFPVYMLTAAAVMALVGGLRLPAG